MEWISGGVISIISYLLPGFLAAWVFYGLTAHPKQPPFERVVQALIFTALSHGATAIAQRILFWAPQYLSFGIWNDESELVWPLVNAVAIGLIFAVFANHDWFHRLLRKLCITKRTSFPSEWFSAFNLDKRYVTLHLKGKRRLYGWPMEWPDQSDSGYFVITEAAWLLDDGQCAALYTVDRVLISASEVEMVEFSKTVAEVSASSDDIKAVASTLIKLHEEGDENDGKQSPHPVAE